MSDPTNIKGDMMKILKWYSLIWMSYCWLYQLVEWVAGQSTNVSVNLWVMIFVAPVVVYIFKSKPE